MRARRREGHSVEKTSAAALAVLEIHPCPGRTLHLAGDAVIGRAPGCEIRLDDPLVSRRHARVLMSEIGVGLEDLDSANGVFVNARRCRGITALHPGDLVQIGGAVWRVLGPDYTGGRSRGSTEREPTS